jgi:hypothetical protein
MYLTITTTHTPATDLGYLLHKRPGKLHTVFTTIRSGTRYNVFTEQALPQ